MKILLVAPQAWQLNAFAEKFQNIAFSNISSLTNSTLSLQDFDIVVDFEAATQQQNLQAYQAFPHLVVFANTPLLQLARIAPANLSFCLIGFNGLPVLFSQELLELSAYSPEHKQKAQAALHFLGKDTAWVADRVGMVTPRIIAMIVNEAFYTLQEGTASHADINTSMKLGTNYPFGPFEWAEKIGLENIYNILDAVYQDTRDERYRICPMLKTEVLHQRNAPHHA
jgi:3-hydroxybutyryl-CoA dehydrogenase